jgi:hypothetical protein
MEEIDYLISLLNTKQTAKNVQKLSQVNYYGEDENSNNNTKTNLILPALTNKTDSNKNIKTNSKLVKMKPKIVKK